MFKTFLKIFTVIALVNFSSTELPPQIQTCPRNLPNYNDCLKSALENLRPLLKTGQIAPGFVTEGLDPLLIGDVTVNRGFDMRLTALKVFGISNFVVEKIRVNTSRKDKFKIEAILLIQKLATRSDYTLKWNLGFLKLQGNGDGGSNLENLKIHLKLTGNLYPKNGVDYARVTEVKFSLKPGTIRVQFNNLFNGQKDLERVANEAINQNINLITEDLFPQIERALEKKTIVVANQFFEKAPIAEFFP